MYYEFINFINHNKNNRNIINIIRVHCIDMKNNISKSVFKCICGLLLKILLIFTLFIKTSKLISNVEVQKLGFN